eukprot:7927190-Alexandrium_andersonii.AAC.1
MPSMPGRASRRRLNLTRELLGTGRLLYPKNSRRTTNVMTLSTCEVKRPNVGVQTTPRTLSGNSSKTS